MSDETDDPREIQAMMLAISFLWAGFRHDAQEQQVIADEAGFRDLVSGLGHVVGLTAKLAVAAMTGRPLDEVGDEDVDNVLARFQQGHIAHEAGQVALDEY